MYRTIIIAGVTVTAGGATVTGASSITQGGVNDVILTLNGIASQAGDFLKAEDDSNNVKFQVDKDGDTTIAGDLTLGKYLSKIKT